MPLDDAVISEPNSFAKGLLNIGFGRPGVHSPSVIDSPPLFSKFAVPDDHERAKINREVYRDICTLVTLSHKLWVALRDSRLRPDERRWVHSLTVPQNLKMHMGTRERPVLPISAMTSPLATVSPTATRFLLCA